MEAAGIPAVEEKCGASGADPIFPQRPSAAADTTRYQPLVIVVFAVAAGIIFDRYGPGLLPVRGEWCLAASCLLAWWFAWRRQRNVLAAWLLLAAAAMVGAAWHHARWQLFDRDEIGRFAAYDPSPVCVEAVARQSPERVSAPPPNGLRAIPAGEKSRLLVDVTSIRDGAEWRPASGVCQLSVEGHLLGIHQGDRLCVFGQFARIASPLNPGEFDFAEHARADRQFVRVHSSVPECVTKLDHGSSWSPTHLLDTIRVRAKQSVRSLVGPNRAGVAEAILLGAREGLPYEETESYMVTGTIHILVVSGLHVAILASGLVWLMRIGWMPRRTVLSY